MLKGTGEETGRISPAKVREICWAVWPVPPVYAAAGCPGRAPPRPGLRPRTALSRDLGRFGVRVAGGPAMTDRRNDEELERRVEAIARELRDTQEVEVPPEVEARILAMAAQVAKEPLHPVANAPAPLPIGRPRSRRTWRYLVPVMGMAAAAAVVLMVRAPEYGPEGAEVLVEPPPAAKPGLRRAPAGEATLATELAPLRAGAARAPAALAALDAVLRAAAEGRVSEVPVALAAPCPGGEQERRLWREGERPLVLRRGFTGGRIEWTLYPGAAQGPVGLLLQPVETAQGPRLAVRVAPRVAVPELAIPQAAAGGCELK